MELNRYDIVEAEINGSGSVQGKKRPFVIVSNMKSVEHSNIVTVMPLTHIIKKTYLPVHACIHAGENTGLRCYSMIIGEQPQTISKDEVISKLGTVTDKQERNAINKVCFNTFFFGEDINWGEVLA